MFRHGPSCLEGPVSRTLGRWLEKEAPVADPNPCRSGSNSAEHSPQVLEIRTGLVERIRREIAEGRYETAEKWEAALEVLFQRLRDA